MAGLKLAAFGVALGLVMGVQPAGAVGFSFKDITDKATRAGVALEDYLWMEVDQAGLQNSQVAITFHNDANLAPTSSGLAGAYIAEVYFTSGLGLPPLAWSQSSSGGDGAYFQSKPLDPKNLPGGNSFELYGSRYSFKSVFGEDSDIKKVNNHLDAGETWTLTYTPKDTSYSDILKNLEGDLEFDAQGNLSEVIAAPTSLIGLHVRSIGGGNLGGCGGSDSQSYVDMVLSSGSGHEDIASDGGMTLVFLGLGLITVGALRRL